MRLERLQKVLANAGVASRRKCEELILAGRVRVNGKVVTEMGVKVDGRSDKIELDGRRVVREKRAYYVLHKPREMVCTLDDPEERASLSGIVKRLEESVHPVGRLDYHTSGVLLLTNDGAFTDGLLRPKRGVPKTYLAKVQGNVALDALGKLRQGVTLDDGYVTKPAEVFVHRSEAKTTWLSITLKEGKNRQIHRMGDALGHRVMRLVRQSFAGITVEGLRPGQYRPLNEKELEQIGKKYLGKKTRGR